MATDLTTTNVLLGVMAGVSLLEAIAVVGLFGAGALLFRQLFRVINDIEERQVKPAVDRVNAILDDVRDVSSRVRDETERVDRTIHRAVNIVESWRTASRASHSG